MTIEIVPGRVVDHPDGKTTWTNTEGNWSPPFKGAPTFWTTSSSVAFTDCTECMLDDGTFVGTSYLTSPGSRITGWIDPKWRNLLHGTISAGEIADMTVSEWAAWRRSDTSWAVKNGAIGYRDGYREGGFNQTRIDLSTGEILPAPVTAIVGYRQGSKTHWHLKLRTPYVIELRDGAELSDSTVEKGCHWPTDTGMYQWYTELRKAYLSNGTIASKELMLSCVRPLEHTPKPTVARKSTPRKGLAKRIDELDEYKKGMLAAFAVSASLSLVFLLVFVVTLLHVI